MKSKSAPRAVAACLFLLWSLFTAKLLAIEVGQPAPAWVLPELSGQTLRSSDFSGKVVILNFFRIICPPCVREVPELRALQAEYGPRGLAVIGIGVYEDPGPLRDFAATHGIDYPVCYPQLFTPGEQILWDYGVMPSAAVPVTTIIDRQGKVAGHYRRFYPKEFYQEVLEPLLAPAVQLRVQRRDKSLLLSWPAEASGFVLEGTAAPTLAGAAWATITNTVTLSNGLHHVAMPASGSSRYFRLRKP